MFYINIKKDVSHLYMYEITKYRNLVPSRTLITTKKFLKKVNNLKANKKKKDISNKMKKKKSSIYK